MTPTITGTPPTATPTPHENVFILSFQKPDGTGEVNSDGALVTQRMKVIGTVDVTNLDRWDLECMSVSGESWSVIASGKTNIIEGQLGIFDPTLLLNGQYQMRVTVYEITGDIIRSAVSNAVFTVDGNMKIGNFTMSFTDLDVPVAGVPMQVVRSYDSRNKAAGDFGTGWTLDIKNMKLEESCRLGEGWHYQKVSAGYFVYKYCIQGTRTHIVTVTIPGGKVYRFEAVADGGCDFLPVNSAEMKFVQLGEQGAALKPIDKNPAFIVNGDANGPIQLLDNSSSIWDANVYQLTTMDGTSYIISRTGGLQSMTDMNGNKLTIDKSGIHYSHGSSVIKEILFTRDGQGRITKVTDPEGHNCAYTYDTNGDLTEYKDRVQTADSSKGKVTFSYNTTHGLIDISDPRNNAKKPITNYYDDSGRLTKNIDAYGNEIDYTHNIDTKTEAVQDRNKNTTTYTYDSRGNVLTTTDALGHITTYTYDDYDNKTSETIAGGAVTTYEYANPPDHLMTAQVDPLGHRTEYTYDGSGRVLTTKDPLNHITQNYYSPEGNLMWTQDAKGNRTFYNYDSSGNMTYMKDVEGNETTYAYDGNGYQTSQTQCGVTTSFTYDNIGNRKTESKPQSAGINTLTSFDYDANGRNTKTTYTDDTHTQTIYDSLGKAVVKSDQKDRETQTDYDDMGRVEKVTYPDGHYEVSEYDAEGHRTKSTQYFGPQVPKVTNYEYDVLGRMTKTTYPDGLYSTTHYDAQGRVDYETDEQGVTTSYTYDLAGRRLTASRGSMTTTYGYDDNGNQTSVTDPAGHTTYTDYDELNRAWRIRFSNGTSKTYEFDKLGRKKAEIDEAGKRTEYNYDCAGRLTSVKDAMNGVTSYGYDLAGNMITQTDALNHVTTYEYDPMNRRVKRTLPAGQYEMYEYDKYTGTMTKKINFNGETITYAYDPTTDRLTSKSGTGINVTYGYDEIGRRAYLDDALGHTTYNYDVRDRLTSKASPLGTLTYTYTTGMLTGISSNHANGVNTTYGYDTLSRLQTVTDNRLSNSTSYTYDTNGNLATCTYPNNVRHTWNYDSNNRLTNLTISNIANNSVLNSYTYTLGPTGNRTNVVEDSGRTVDWSYDDLYRLTNETVTNSTTSANYSVSYTYDAVGNRQTRSMSPGASIPQLPDQSFAGTYDANDRLLAGGSYSYDDNGSTTSHDGWSYTYDAEGRLLTADKTGDTISYTYDGDGGRVQKTINGIVTRYLTDSLNPTGYAQVVEELDSSNNVQKRYTYGLDLISQTDVIGTAGTQYYGYDGIGSTRILTDATGVVTDIFDYDAFGSLLYTLHPTISTNNYLFHGEYYDSDLGLVFLRARWMDESIGRFWGMDGFEGRTEEPYSLHKYNFTLNPINYTDPSGFDGIIGPMGDRISELLKGIAINLDDTIKLIIKTAVDNNIPVNVFGSLIYSESGFNPMARHLNWDKKRTYVDTIDLGLGQINTPYNDYEGNAEDYWIMTLEIMQPADNLDAAATLLNAGKEYGEKHRWDKQLGGLPFSPERLDTWFLGVWGYKGFNVAGHDNAVLWRDNYYKLWPDKVRKVGKNNVGPPLSGEVLKKWKEYSAGKK